MTVLATVIDSKSESFRGNAASLRKLTDDLKAEEGRLRALEVRQAETH